MIYFIKCFAAIMVPNKLKRISLSENRNIRKRQRKKNEDKTGFHCLSENHLLIGLNLHWLSSLLMRLYI